MSRKVKEQTDFWREDVYGSIKERCQFLKKQIIMLEKRISTYPQGMIHDTKCRESFQYYWRRDKSDVGGEYLGLEKRGFAKKMCQKYYDEVLLKGIRNELLCLEKYLKKVTPGYISLAYEKLSEGKKILVDPIVGKEKEYVKKWENVEYPPGYFPENAKEYYTQKQERVHSKSEIIIANLLKANGIPYRYEFPLYLDGLGEKRPDFYCLNVRLRKEIVWEHLGMMEISCYASDNVKKVNSYISNGFYCGENLILTFETSAEPVDTKIVQDMIDKYLK